MKETTVVKIIRVARYTIAISLALAILLLACCSKTNAHSERTSELQDVLLNELHFLRLPQTGRCYAYAWIRDSDWDNATGGAVVFEVPCEIDAITRPVPIEAPPCQEKP